MFGASPSQAQLVAGVSFDFLGDAAASITPIFEQIQTKADEAIKFVKEKVTALKASIGSYFGKRKNAAEKVPGTRKFAESSVDIYDPTAVQAAFNELFLQYPSDDPRINKLYENEAAEFYYDTLIEIQTASQRLEEELNNLRSEIDTFSKDAVAPSGGSAGSVSSEDENGNYYNLYLAHKKFNDVLKITEEVMALYSQYYVARAIYRKTILPAPYEKDSEDTSSDTLSSSQYFHSKIAFAQYVSAGMSNSAAKAPSTSATATKVGAVAKAPSASAMVTKAGAVAKAPSASATATKAGTVAKAPSASATATKAGTVAKAPSASATATKAGAVAKAPSASATATKAGTVAKAQSASATVTKAGAVARVQNGDIGIISKPDEEEATVQTKEFQPFVSTKQVPLRQVSATQSQKQTLEEKDILTAAEDKDDNKKVVSKGKVSFSVPAAPTPQPLMSGSKEQFEALQHISEAQKYLNSAIEVHNLVKQLPEYRKLFQQYEMYKKLHEKAQQAVADSDKCVIQYLGRHYAQPEKVWYGSTRIPTDPTDYDNRTGLSGWAISAFQVANADKSAGLDTDSFSTIDLGYNAGNTSVSEIDKIQEQVSKIDSSSALAAPSQEESFSESTREVELIVWQIGAQAAKILAEDQYASDSLYGRAENPYPLWQDQKSFYNQYIDGKYENMKNYIRQLDLTEVALRIAEIINDDREDGTLKNSTQSGLNRISSYLSNQKSAGSADTTMVDAKKSALAKVDSAETAALKTYKAQKEKLLSQLDTTASKISSLNDEVSQADSDTETGKAQVASSYNTIKLMNSRGDTSNSTLYAAAGKDFSSGSKQELENTRKANNLRLEVKTYEEERDSINQKLEAIEKRIASIEEDYINRKAVIEAEYAQKMETASNSSSAPTLASLISKLNIHATGLSGVASKADGLVSDAKEYAIKLIDEARNDLYNLGDGLYETRNNAVVVRRHKELIESLKEMPKTQFISSAMLAIGGGSTSAIVSLMSSALNSAITQDICGQVSCNSADTEYFVGLGAKKRDFKAPRAPEFEHYPSPRDIVHFDATDYRNIKKSQDGVISKDSFLEYGGEIPNIWKQMLSENAFVEKGLDLSNLLEQGGESKSFMRGTLYPCRIGNKTVDVAASKVDLSQTSGRYLISRNGSSKIPTCLDISLKGTLYYTVTDLELDKSVSAGTQEAATSVTASELGTLLSYSGQKLRFNETAYDVYERMLELEDDANGDDFDYEVRDNVYQKAMYANNQIGNFLHFVDKENNIRKSVEELALSIDDARNTIKEYLSAMGFKVSANFNLANDDEYNYIRTKLLEYKNSLVGQAHSQISGLNATDAVVSERYAKANNTRAALVQDYDALINMNNSTEAGSSLEESIISERANQEVMSKSQDQSLSGLQDEINNYEIPMCMAY